MNLINFILTLPMSPKKSGPTTKYGGHKTASGNKLAPTKLYSFYMFASYKY